MKSPKVIYIVIVGICAIAIGIGIYAQFFVAEEDKNDVIIPNLIQQDEVLDGKSSEELKETFNSLFTNVVNLGNYDTSQIIKINNEKEIVYSAYDMQEQKENYEINIHLPVINIQGETVAEFNEITQNVFANKTSEILSNQNTNKIIYNVDYVGYINRNILSLIIKSTLKEGENPQRVIVQTYNYNLTTGKKVELPAILSEIGLTQDAVQRKINTVIQKAENDAKILELSGYSVYRRNSKDDMYLIGNVTNYFLGPSRELYVVFAYGNQKFTSEMDIVLIEQK